MDTARSILHLHLAYAATWVIHLSYIVYLTLKAVRLGKELRGE